jgi:hypothetical protein
MFPWLKGRDNSTQKGSSIGAFAAREYVHFLVDISDNTLKWRDCPANA